ncbi:MAG: SH3 domain-containing protein [Roseiflexaceae bacterium]
MFHKRFPRALPASLLALLLISCGSAGNPTATAGRDTTAIAAAPAARATPIPPLPTAELIGEPPARATAAPTAPEPTSATLLPLQDTPVATTPDAAQPTPAQSPLQRHDTPPAEVVAYLQKEYGGLAFTCQALPDDSLGLRITIYAAEHETGEGFSFCFSGYAQNQPIQVAIARPDGTVLRQEVPALPFGPEAMDWVTRPGDPLGQYTVTATQGDQRATGGFTLRSASRPRMVVFQDAGAQLSAAGSPGSTFQVALAGFQPQQQVLLHVYAIGDTGECPSDTPDCWAYRTSLPPIQVDAAGQAMATVSTTTDDNGIYRLVPEPAASTDGAEILSVDRDNPLPDTTLSAGQPAVTRPPFARDLWAAPTGDQRVDERPKLYGGALLTILAVETDAVQVRTEDGVEGWIREPAVQALTSHLDVQGARKSFPPQARVRISLTNGIPLRAEPRSDAAKLLDKLELGRAATVQELRGDWLKILLDDGTSGWARWYYDGTQYISTI